MHSVNRPLYSLCIFLFIQIKMNRNTWNRPPVFIYLSKSLVVRHGFLFNIHYLFVQLLKVMSTKARGTDHLILFSDIIFFFHMSLQVIFFQLHEPKLLEMKPLDNLIYLYNVLIKRNLLLKIYSYSTVMVMCVKQQKNAN